MVVSRADPLLMTRWELVFRGRSGSVEFLLKSPVHLDQKASLPAQVAEFLLRGRSDGVLDLGGTVVLIPTAGAGRAIRRELAKKGVFSPTFRLPMEALEPVGEGTASRLEREAAWVMALDPRRRESFAALVPLAVNLDSPDDRFGVAARLCTVCDQLAEAGYVPSSPELLKLLPEDSVRWEAFGKIYRQYLDLLSKHGLSDPNALRLQQAWDPSITQNLKRAVVACIPDLPVIVQKYLEALSNKGIAVEILVWNPMGAMADIGDQGRPETKAWCQRTPAISGECLAVENDTSTEAGVLLDFAAQHRDLGYALFSAAPESTSALAAEILQRGSVPYLPEGRALTQSEAAAILHGWDHFRNSRRLRDLRPLLHWPVFATFLQGLVPDSQGRPTVADLLTACDVLMAERLCETVDAAVSWLRLRLKHREKDAEQIAIEQFLAAVDLLLVRNLHGQQLLVAAYDHAGAIEAGSATAVELAAMAEVNDQFDDSSLLLTLDEPARKAAVRADINRKRLFLRKPDGAVEVQGWLEAPWTDSPTLIVAGCREGALPSGTHEDAFLPDAARKALCLTTQDSRYARDAYLLACLLASRPPAHLRFGASRFRPQGEPNRPSRLLFGCGDGDLGERVKLIFTPTGPAKRRTKAGVDWKLRIPQPTEKQFPVRAISVTAFKSYLQCPLRFYLGHVLGLRDFEADAREISAADFGTVMHKVLETCSARDEFKDATDPAMIYGMLSQQLDHTASGYFGVHLSPVVRVQIESMRARFRPLAEVQARERSDGWRILEAEYKVKAADGIHLAGNIVLKGTMDRIEHHHEKGLRVLDYKTFSTPKTPAQTHLVPPREPGLLPEANLTYKGKSRSWKDLQLPLYCWLAGQIWRDKAAAGVSVGYFLVPPDGEDAPDKVIRLLDLEEGTVESAVSCAKKIGTLVGRGVFWPPSPSARVDFDNFESWFGGGDPKLFIDAESQQQLQGVSS